LQVIVEATKVILKGTQSKFLCSKVVPKGMQSLQRKINADTAEVKGEEAPKGGLQRKINADTVEVKGEEAPKGGLQRKINADTAEVKGEEAPKGGLHRKVSADEPKNDQKID
jgi:hypothetical protein